MRNGPMDRSTQSSSLSPSEEQYIYIYKTQKKKKKKKKKMMKKKMMMMMMMIVETQGTKPPGARSPRRINILL